LKRPRRRGVEERTFHRVSMQISIAMCTCNGATYLRRQLESFARQTSLPCELVVCDDRSSDATLTILKEFAGTAPFHVRLFENEKNLGSTKNFEQAIGLCRGDLIALADQDDEWYTQKLEQFGRFFHSFPEAILAFSDADLIDDRHDCLNRRLWQSVYFSAGSTAPHVERNLLCTLLKLNSVATGATMVLRAQLRPEILPIPDGWVHDAWIVWMAAITGCVGILPQAQMRYRLHAAQQLGLDPPSLLERLRHARRSAIQNNVAWIRMLEQLKLRLQAGKDSRSQAVLPTIDAKIKHLKGRTALSPSFVSRTWWIVSSWREYSRYTRGTVSMLKDMFFPSESAST
jgi:glycosyltransferase involved in cell wall biosynthesis